MDNEDRRVIGFDLGHGETALASLRLNSTDSPAIVEVGNQRKLVTAVGRRADGGVEIGARAVRHDTEGTYLGFKSRDVTAEATREGTALFVGEVLRQLKGNAMYRDSPVSWMFGVPSGWSVENQAEYGALLDEIIGEEVTVIAESRAALLHARDACEVALSDSDIDAGVLIVDIGSSTTDYTWVAQLTARPLDSGHSELGASLIDREIVRRFVAAHPDQELLASILAYRNNSVILELQCRQAKELFFTEASRDDDEFASRRYKTEQYRNAAGESLDLTVSLSLNDMSSILDTPLAELGGGSWHDVFRDRLDQVIAEVGVVPGTLLLTGGASRMWFAQELCRKAVGDDRVVVGQEPEFTIAKGLALAYRSSYRVRAFRATLDAFIASGAIQETVRKELPDLAAKLGTSFAKGKVDTFIVPAFRKWRNGEFRTIKAMRESVIADIKRAAVADQAWLNSVVVPWQNKLATLLGEQTRPICTQAGISPDLLDLPRIDVNRTEATPMISAAPALGAISQLGNVIGVVVSASLAAMALAVMGAFAIGGPISFFVIATAGTIAVFVGKEAAMTKLQSSDLPDAMRKMRSEKTMVRKITDRRATIEAQLAAAVTEEITKKTDEIAKDASDAVERQLRERADRAELLIL